jgi:hypothetical protein
MRKYWKVHRNSIKFFPDIFSDDIETITNACDGKIDGILPNCYVYIISDFYKGKYNNFGFMPFEEESIKFFNNSGGYEYCGVFKTIKDIRKEKLQKIYEIKCRNKSNIKI